MKNFIDFTYSVINRELCLDEKTIVLNLQTLINIGWKTQRIWNNQKRWFTEERLYFVNFNGTEYGSETDYSQLLRKQGCRTDDSIQIFEEQFENIFE